MAMNIAVYSSNCRQPAIPWCRIQRNPLYPSNNVTFMYTRLIYFTTLRRPTVQGVNLFIGGIWIVCTQFNSNIWMTTRCEFGLLWLHKCKEHFVIESLCFGLTESPRDMLLLPATDFMLHLAYMSIIYVQCTHPEINQFPDMISASHKTCRQFCLAAANGASTGSHRPCTSWLCHLAVASSPPRILVSVHQYFSGLLHRYLDEVKWWRHQMELFSASLAFVGWIHRWLVNSPHKGQWRGGWMLPLNCTLINDWVNNREAVDLRRNRAHYDVIVMILTNIDKITDTKPHANHRHDYWEIL